MCRRQLSLIALLLLAALVGGMGWTIYATIHQERLNHALISAIKQNNTKTALALLAEGADANSRDEPSQHLSLWRLLLDRLRGKHPAPSTAPTALLLAMQSEDNHDSMYAKQPPEKPTLIRALLKYGANPNIHAPFTLSDSLGGTPLIIAARKGEIKTVQLLLDGGADINARDPSGFTALEEAVCSNAQGDRVKVVRLLLSRHPNVNTKDNCQMSPLAYARDSLHVGGLETDIQDYKAIVDILKQAGAKE